MSPRTLVLWLAAAGLVLLAWLGWARILDRRDTGANAVDRATVARLDTVLARRDSAIARRDTAIAALLAAVAARDADLATARRQSDRTARDAADAIAAALAAPGDTAKAADAFRACRLAVADARAERTPCDAAKAARDSAIDSLRTQLADAKAQRATAAEQSDAWQRIALRPGPRIETSVAALYDWTAGAPVAEAGVRLRLAGRLAAVGAVRQALAPREGPHVIAGLKWTF